MTRSKVVINATRLSEFDSCRGRLLHMPLNVRVVNNADYRT